MDPLLVVGIDVSRAHPLWRGDRRLRPASGVGRRQRPAAPPPVDDLPAAAPHGASRRPGAAP